MLDSAKQAELDELVGNFSGIFADLKLENFGLGSQRILAGYEGKIVKMGFAQLTENQGVTKLDRDQTVRVPAIPASGSGANKIEAVEARTIVLAKKGEMPVTLQLEFEDGRTIAVNALKQSSKSMVEHADGTTVQTIGLSVGDWSKMVGKTFYCQSTGSDEDNIVRRPDNDGKLTPRAARYFTFKIS